MLRSYVQAKLSSALLTVFPGHANLPELKLERPRQAAHGDYAVNVASLSKWLKQPPVHIAQTIGQALQSETGWTVNVVGAFVNIALQPPLLAQALLSTLKDASGHNGSLADQVISLEYVSANPTGPLHIGHGRWAALGDSLRRVLERCGAQVRAEFYINDAGAQMGNLARSLWWRCRMLLDPQVAFPVRPDNPDTLYPYYPGDYLIPVAEAFLAEHPHAFDGVIDLDERSPLFQQLRSYARHRLLAHQQATLEQLNVRFDRWISETALYDSGQVTETLKRVVDTGYTYTQDGALWLKTTDFGDEKDRVLQKQDGTYTYLTPDIACHLAKWEYVSDPQAPRVTQMINIWGADHHGYMARLQASLTLLGLPQQALRILLGQLVNLVINGEVTRMGKRRQMVTLQDLVDEAGPDATRFWMVSKSADTALDFDVDLATSQSSENPVFYVQYAHARCCGIIRHATEPTRDRESGEEKPALMGSWDFYRASVGQAQAEALWANLDTPEQQQAVKVLVLRLSAFSDMVADAGRLLSPYLVARYAQDLAADFHHFYTHCRVLTDDPAISGPRLLLIDAVRSTLASALELLGVSAPERM